jgi:1,4-dihydroxy-2-naphthoate polyprenyltransferase
MEIHAKGTRLVMSTAPSPESTARPSPARTWLIAIRPFALPASATPVIFGTFMAVTVAKAPFKGGLFLMALFAMMALHSAANIINDIYDYRKGIDRDPRPTSGAIVRGYVSVRGALLMALALIGAGCALGLVIAYLVGPVIFYIGIAGLSVGVSYSAPPLSLKYRGLGDLAVFLDFGILGALGAWAVQTGTLSWTPALWAIPLSLLVVAILHANNWRDMEDDGEKGVKTVASALGDRRSLNYYGVLIFGAPLGILIIVIVTRLLPFLEPMPLSFIVTLLALFPALGLWKKAKARHNPSNPLDFIALDGATAQYNLIFGMLSLAALALHAAAGAPW